MSNIEYYGIFFVYSTILFLIAFTYCSRRNLRPPWILMNRIIFNTYALNMYKNFDLFASLLRCEKPITL